MTGYELLPSIIVLVFISALILFLGLAFIINVVNFNRRIEEKQVEGIEFVKKFVKKIEAKQHYEYLGEGWEGYIVYMEDINNLLKEMEIE